MDLRQRVVDSCLAHDLTYREVADRFSVGEASVSRWLRRHRETGGVEPKGHAGGARPKVDIAGLELLRQLVAERPDATLKELAQSYENARSVRLALSIVCRALNKLELTRKKSRSTRPNANAKMCGSYAGTSNESNSG
jgi:transposase